MSGPKVDSLRDIGIFAGLDDAALERIAALATEFEVPAGHVLIHKDQPGSGMFVVEEGTLVVELPGGEKELGPGDFVGETSLLTDAPRTARVKAKTPVIGLALGRHEFDRLLEEQPRIGVAMLKPLAERLVDLH